MPPSPDYSNLGPSASQVGGSPQNVLTLTDLKESPSRRGSLVHTIKYEGSGGWINSKAGRMWVSAKHIGAKVIDVNKTCFAAFLPPDMDKNAFCTKKSGCLHSLPTGYAFVVSFDRALRDDELITKRPREDGYSRNGRGRGSSQSDYSHNASSWGGAKGAWPSKRGRAKGDWGAKGDWSGKGQQWGGNQQWGGKGDWSAQNDWSGKGSWGGKGEWAPKLEYNPQDWSTGEKGKGKGKGKGANSWGKGWQ